ncbi:nucleoside recognition domain-containing protein [Petroclostridium sp. X23]|uniref:nucleoside recognition domain-containing protein n=1 Tax=Petroclostridium sp. X23 TaxID=3045146 RepID=UPI0024AD0701|nr:nucleoside recognition domain-containing protein [Petroclostridium sp. X23]WHH57062.1 nucleoside recognition domain-containing protein [Petroclostridium sp. X23]
MLNYIWSGMILIGFIVAAFTGRIEQTTQAAFDSASTAVQMSIGLLGVMCLWTGLMNIAERSGLIKVIARIIQPVTKLLFPQVPAGSPAMGAIVLNMVANMMGLSNAATPLGLKAIKELQKLNRGSDIASNAMCMFVVVNTASIQIIPATIIAVRTSAGSGNPFEIIATVWVASICAVIVGVTAAKILQGKEKDLRSYSRYRRVS